MVLPFISLPQIQAKKSTYYSVPKTQTTKFSTSAPTSSKDKAST